MQYAAQIQEMVDASRDHPTAEQIYLRMKENGSAISLATVYNHLSRLSEQEHIRRISVAGQPDRYDRIQRHDHLVCRECGALDDILFPDLSGWLQAQTGEQLLDYDLRVGWLCPSCRQEPAQSSSPAGSIGTK